MAGFSRTDGWVLCSIAMATPERASLREIVGTADMLNASLLTLAEINSSIARLHAAGLVRVDDRLLSVSPEVRSFLAGCKDIPARVVCWEKVPAYLASLEIPEPVLSEDIFTSAELAAAEKLYRKEVSAALRRLRSR